MAVWWLLLVLSLSLNFNANSAVRFKAQKVYCKSFDNSLAVVNHCYLKAFSREIAKIYMNVTLLKKFYAIDLNGEWRVKSTNGYKPFLYNVTADACAFMDKPKNIFLTIVHTLFKEFSNINHTCPYYGHQILSGFYLKKENLLNNLPIPNGEYGLLLTWIMDKTRLFVTDVYFEYNAGINN